MESQPVSVQDNNTNSATPASTKLPSAFALLKEAWRLYKSNLAAFLQLMGLWVVGFIVFTIGIVVAKSLPSPLGILLIVLGFIIFMALNVLIPVAMISVLAGSHAGPITASKALAKGVRRILPYIWTSFLGGILTIGAFFLLIIPGILFSLWFSLAIYIVMAEGRGGMYALLKSKDLIKGRLCSVFWRQIVLGAMAIAVGVVLVAIVFVSTFFASGEIKMYSKETGDVLDIIAQVLSMLFTPLALAYLYLIYRNLLQMKGEAALVPASTGRKIKYLTFGLVGFVVGMTALIIIIVLYATTTVARLRDAERTSDVATIQIELERFYVDNGVYPAALTALEISDSRFVDYNGATYEYTPRDGGQWYSLCANFEGVGKKQCFDPETNIQGIPDDRNQ